MSDIKIYNPSTCLNILGILFAAIILTLSSILRSGLLPLISNTDYLSIISLVAIVLILPDFLIRFLRPSWYYSIEFITIFLVFSLTIIGLLLQSTNNWGRIVIIPVGVGLIGWELYRFSISINWINFISGIAFMGFIYFSFYAQGYHNILFPEKIVLDQGHIDVLYNSSISSIFSSHNYASTGLSGSPYIHYHWGSHAILAGLKNFAGVNSIITYNILFPILFIPLFLKSLVILINRYSNFRKKNYFNLVLFFSFLALLYSIDFLGYYEAPLMPMMSESFCVSMIISFLYLSTLLIYIRDNQKRSFIFYFTTTWLLLLIALSKISTGFILFAGIAYLFLSLNLSYKRIFIVFFSGLILSTIILLYIYPVYRPEINISFAKRILNFWQGSYGLITYFAGVLLFTLVIYFENGKHKFQSFKQALLSRKYIELELMIVMSLFGIVGGWIVSARGIDVFYFFSTQLFLTLVFLIYYANRLWVLGKLSTKTQNIILVSILFLSILSRPDIISKAIQNHELRNSAININYEEILMSELILDLNLLEQTTEKNNSCIYIPHSESWYYKSKINSLFVVPAISGIPLINGIPSTFYDRDGINLSIIINPYQKFQKLLIENNNNVLETAKILGYKKLIKYREIDNKLSKELINLY